MDPIAQAMQILQFITQRRGQQADIEQGNRRLDLQEVQQQMAGEQFGQTMDFNRQKQQQDALQFARDMALRELAQKQGAEQFGQKMIFDQEQAQAQQSRFDAELQQKLLDRAMENTFRERQLGITGPYQQAITQKLQQEMQGNVKDPRVQALEEEQFRNAIEVLQQQFMQAPNAIERSRIQDQLDAALAQRYGKLLPTKRDYTPDELKTIQTFQ